MRPEVLVQQATKELLLDMLEACLVVVLRDVRQGLHPHATNAKHNGLFLFLVPQEVPLIAKANTATPGHPGVKLVLEFVVHPLQPTLELLRGFGQEGEPHRIRRLGHGNVAMQIQKLTGDQVQGHSCVLELVCPPNGSQLSLEFVAKLRHDLQAANFVGGQLGTGHPLLLLVDLHALVQVIAVRFPAALPDFLLNDTVHSEEQLQQVRSLSQSRLLLGADATEDLADHVLGWGICCTHAQACAQLLGHLTSWAVSVKRTAVKADGLTCCHDRADAAPKFN